jgi:hypothetical protein
MNAYKKIYNVLRQCKCLGLSEEITSKIIEKIIGVQIKESSIDSFELELEGRR